LCFQGNIDGALEVVAESKDPAAAFHLGRQLEAQDKIKEAVMYYSRSKRYSHAVRLAKKHGMVRELMNLSLQVRRNPMIIVEHGTGRALYKWF
jgi:intraflagellar transport protein 140